MGSSLQFCIFSTLLKYASACADSKLNFLLENTLLFVCFLSSFSFFFTPSLLLDNGLSATLLDDLVIKKAPYIKKRSFYRLFFLILNVQKKKEVCSDLKGKNNN